MSLPSVDRIAELQQLIAQFGAVERVLDLPGTSRRENNNDHSYGLALTCWFLQPKIAPGLDLLKVFKYALAHDIVELHAGDTFAFDKEALKRKPKREKAAVKQLREDWPDFPELPEYADQYMDRFEDEARFVKAVDKLLPVIMIDLTGKSEWERLGVTLADERENKVSIHVSEYMSPYYDLLLKWLDDRNNIPKA